MAAKVGEFVKLASDVPGLEALGASTPDDFFAVPPRLITAERALRLGDSFRLPLPGTVDADGKQHEKPRGAGTGQLLVRRFAPAAFEAWRVRFTRPRSTSSAARHWNLMCHLQAQGLATPPLVALFERRGGAESVLVTRELDDFEALSTWLAREHLRAVRRRGLASLALALAQLLRCGAWLPRTTLANVMIQTPESHDCVALKLVNLASEHDILKARGLVRSRLPTVAFSEFGGGRIRTKLRAKQRADWLATLAAEAATLVTVRERRELLVRLCDDARERGALAARCR